MSSQIFNTNNPPNPSSFQSPHDPPGHPKPSSLIDSPDHSSKRQNSPPGPINLKVPSVPEFNFAVPHKAQNPQKSDSSQSVSATISDSAKAINKSPSSSPSTSNQPPINYNQIIQKYRSHAQNETTAPVFPKSNNNKSTTNFSDPIHTGQKYKLTIYPTTSEFNKDKAIYQIRDLFYSTPKSVINKTEKSTDKKYADTEAFISTHSNSLDVHIDFHHKIPHQEKTAIETFIISQQYEHFKTKRVTKKFQHLFLIEVKSTSDCHNSSVSALEKIMTEKDEIVMASNPIYQSNSITASDVATTSTQFLISVDSKMIPRRRKSYPASMRIQILNSHPYCVFCLALSHTRSQCKLAPQ